MAKSWVVKKNNRVQVGEKEFAEGTEVDITDEQAAAIPWAVEQVVVDDGQQAKNKKKGG